jgi:hypothetical protein
MKVQVRRHINEEPQVLNHAGKVRDALRQLSHVAPCPVAERRPSATAHATVAGSSDNGHDFRADYGNYRKEILEREGDSLQ